MFSLRTYSRQTKQLIISMSLVVISYTLFFSVITAPLQEPEPEYTNRISKLSSESTTFTQTEGAVLGDQSPEIYIHGSSDSSFSSGGLITLSSADDPVVKVRTYNLNNSYQVELYEASETDVLRYLEYTQEFKQKNSSVDLNNRRMITSFQQDYRDSDGTSTLQLPLGNTGIYYLRLRNDQFEVHSFIVRSDYGAIAKEGAQEVILWAQDFNNLRRFPQADFTAYNLLNGQTAVYSGQTDDQGIAKFPLEKTVDLVVFRKDNRFAILPINLQYLSSWGGGVESRYLAYNSDQVGSKFFLFTDRPLYRPGDTILFKSIIRDDDDARYTIPSGTARIRLQEGYSEDSVVYEKDFAIDSAGTVSGSIPIDANLKTGDYMMQISIGDATQYIYLQIEHFRKPEYTIDVETPELEYIAGDEIPFDITASFFSGQPVANQNATYHISSRSYYEYEYSRNQYVSDDYYYGGWGSETIQDGTVQLDEKGHARLPIKAVIPPGNKSQIYSISVTYEDETGDPSTDRKSVLVFDGEYGIYRQTTDYQNPRVNQPTELKLELGPHAPSASISNKTLTATVKRTEWVYTVDPNQKYPIYSKVEETLPEMNVKTDTAGKAIFAFTPTKAGLYEFLVTGKDNRGNSIEKDFNVYVSDQNGVYYRNNASETTLTLQTDKEEYELDGTVTATLISTFPFRDVFVDFERGRVDRYQVVSMDTSTKQLSLPIRESDLPNTFLEVSSFSPTSMDSSNLMVKVNKERRRLLLEITPDRTTYKPGENVTLNISTTDIAGKPVATDLAIWAVDKAIFELADEQPKNIFEIFWEERYNSTTQTHSLQGITVNSAERGGGGGGGGRSIFKDTAYWNPNVTTDSSGRAQLTFKLPDNLTTWAISGIGSTSNTTVGSAKNEVKVSKNVVVRPVLPNVLQQDDEIIVEALVQNFTDDTHTFLVDLKFEDGELDVEEPRQVIVKSNDVGKAQWRLTPKTEQEAAKLRFSAVAESDPTLTDTITQTIPIIPFGFEEELGQTGHGERSEFALALPASINLNNSSITLNLASSIIGTLPESVKYLVNYAYGCVEQTTSRFVPTVIAASNPELFNDALEDKNIEDIIVKAVNRLDSLQQNDGGWGWWYHNGSDPFITAYVVEYLLKAEKLGYVQDKQILNDARRFMENVQTSGGTAEDVAKSYALALFNSDKKYQITNFDNLGTDLLALAVMSNTIQGNTDVQTNGTALLISKAKTQNNETSWEAGSTQRFGSINASTAIALRALMMNNSDSTLVSNGMRFLMNQRKASHWDNTYATAQIVQVASDYSSFKNELHPDYTYAVTLDGKRIGSGKVSSATSMIKPIEINLSDLVIGEESVLEVTKEGSGELYSSVVQKNFLTDTSTPAASNGISITREYVSDRGEGYSPAVGDYVTVNLTIDGLVTPQVYGVIHDTLPSGMIPVNPRFNNQSENNNSDFYDYYRYNTEYTLNGAIIPLHQVSAGRTYSYRARVVSQGEFTVPPAKVSLMYNPAFYGHTGVQTISITSESTYTPPLKKVMDILPTLPSPSTVNLVEIIGMVTLIFVFICISIYIRYRMLMRGQSNHTQTHSEIEPPSTNS